MRLADPDSKAVVLSTWPSFLRQVAEALEDNGIAAASLGITGAYYAKSINLKRALQAASHLRRGSGHV